MKYLTNNGYLFLLQVTVIVMKMQWPVLKNGGSIPREGVNTKARMQVYITGIYKKLCK